VTATVRSRKRIVPNKFAVKVLLRSKRLRYKAAPTGPLPRKWKYDGSKRGPNRFSRSICPSTQWRRFAVSGCSAHWAWRPRLPAILA